MALLGEGVNHFAQRMESLAGGGLRLLLRQAAIGIALNAEGNAKQYVTIRKSPGSKRGPVRSGRLRNSIAGSAHETQSGVQVRLSAGGRIKGQNVKYASVQEGPPNGGSHTTIRAKRGYLAIPIHDSLFTGAGVQRFTSPWDVPNLFVDRGRNGNPILRNSVTGEVFYILRKQVEIPAKRFLRDGLQDAIATVPDEYKRTIEAVIRG